MLPMPSNDRYSSRKWLSIGSLVCVSMGEIKKIVVDLGSMNPYNSRFLCTHRKEGNIDGRKDL